ncbi:MAG: hypothetical protein F4W89_07315 [Acidobacteria bacterium]|nr:hypothetical protein [Acidobacteriota bacterium]
MSDPTHTRERRKTIAVCAGVTLLAATLAFWWSTTNRYGLTGDEPHYLILTASLLRDGDLDMQNNYAEDARTAEIYGPVALRHTVGRGGREWPSAAPGISALLVPAFALAGGLGARLMLCLLIIPLLGWACWRWLDGRAPPRDAALAVAGVLVCPTVLLGAGQVYADLLSGAIILALAVWLWNGASTGAPTGPPTGAPAGAPASRPAFSSASRSAPPSAAPEARSPLGWALFGLAAGLLPWLHIKNLAATALFGLFAAWQVWRHGSWREPDARTRWGYAAGGALLLLGPATFLWYELATHGLLLAGQGRVVSGTPYLRAVEMLLGRHLDQSHGLFWQQPLFFPGLIALGWMVRKRHPLTIPWLLLYASLIVPPAVTGRWGGIPSGRFNWGGMWLWLIPIGLWLQAERDTLGRYVRPALLAAFAYQAVLAFRWAPDPTRLFIYEDFFVWARDSLFPLPVRYILPHFYLSPSDSWWVVRYLEYLPNLIWVAAAGLLLATGWMWSTEGRQRLKPVWIGIVAVAALLLPVEPTADAESPHDDGLHDPLARSIQSTFPRRFEAERMTPMQTAERTTRLDGQASGGRARAADGERPDGLITFGPYLNLDAGRYRIEVAMRLQTPSDAAPAAWLDVRTERGQFSHGRVEVPAARLPTDGTYAIVSASVDAVEPLEDLEFIVGAYPGVELLVDYIDLIPVLP